MKKAILFVLVSCFCIAGFAGDPQIIESDVIKATVFLNGAQLTRIGKASLPAGQTEVVFRGVEAGVLQNSIQAAATGNVIILSLTKATNYLKPK